MTPGQTPSLLADYSIDLPARDVPGLDAVRAAIPPATRIHLGFLDGEDMAARVRAAWAVRRSGFVPVPIIPARRLRSEATFREYLAALRAADAGENVLVVGGDPAQPLGPYADTVSVIGSGLLEEHAVRRVSVAGHPGGTRRSTAVRCGRRWPRRPRRLRGAAWPAA